EPASPRVLEPSPPANHREGIPCPLPPKTESAEQASSLPAATRRGDKGKARAILDAIRTLKRVEQEGRAATKEEREALSRFGGFGAVALSLFPDPVKEPYKDAPWQALGRDLKSLLTDAEYDTAKRTTFNAFYTPRLVMRAMFQGLSRLGVPEDATVLEPG